MRRSRRDPWSMPALPKAYVAQEDVSDIVAALISPDIELKVFSVVYPLDEDQRRALAKLIMEAHLQATAWRNYNIVSSRASYARSALAAIEHMDAIGKDTDFRTSLLIARDCLMAMPAAEALASNAFERITELHQLLQSNVWSAAQAPLLALAQEAARKAKGVGDGKPEGAYRRMFIRYLTVDYANREGRLPPKGLNAEAKSRRTPGARFHEFVHAALADVRIALDPRAVTKAIRAEIDRLTIERGDKSPLRKPR